MALVISSECRLEFIPNDRSENRPDSPSPNALIELRQHDFDDHFIRVVDADDDDEVFSLNEMNEI